MERRDAITTLGVLGMTGLAQAADAIGGAGQGGRRAPALFVGHGSPMNAIQDTRFGRAWEEIGASMERPRAILCVSAHWQTPGTRVTAMERPRTIHDFSGFPDELNTKVYPAPGAPALAAATAELVAKTRVGLDQEWGLDHGTWSVLVRMFPRADVPVFQLSLDERQGPAWHYELGRELRILRERGVLVMGSGNVVHNLRRLARPIPDGGFDWAVEFDARIKELIDRGDHRGVVEYQRLGRAAQLAVPTDEHFLPLLYVLAAAGEGEPIVHFNDALTMGSISMRSLLIG